LRRKYALNEFSKNLSILFYATPVLILLRLAFGRQCLATGEAQNPHPLEAAQRLQKNLPPVLEPYRVAIGERLGTRLDEDNL
jgi:hypothetical protein